MLVMQLVMVYLFALHIITTDAACTSNESSTLNCSHMVTPNMTNDACLNSSIPCCDISTYIQNSTFKSNTTFCFLSGTHVIKMVDPMLIIENSFDVSLIGLGSLIQHSVKDKVSEYNFKPYEDDENIIFFQSTTIIQCDSPFAFIFSSITNLKLINITIQNCGENIDMTRMDIPSQENDFLLNNTKAAFFLVSVTNLTLENTSVQNSRGYGFVGINMLGYSQLIGSSFIGNNQYIKDMNLSNKSYQSLFCNDRSCPNNSYIYLTASNDGKTMYPGGNALFIYQNSTDTSQIQISSSLFTLGVDDSISSSIVSGSSYKPPDGIPGTGLSVMMLHSTSVNVCITNTVSYRNQAVMGANFYFQETYENSVILLLNVSSTRGYSPYNGGAFYYTSYGASSSIVFDGSIFSSDCFSVISTSVYMKYVGSLQMNHSCILGQLIAYYTNGIICNSSFQTMNCNGVVNTFNSNISVTNSTFDGTNVVSNYGNVDVTDSQFINCQTTALRLIFSSAVFKGSVNFTNNFTPSNGGALSLYFSNVTFQAFSDVTFLNNSAKGKGGVMYIVDDSSYTTECCVIIDDRYGNLSSPGIKLFIANSSAGIAGNILYGGNFDQCYFNCSKVPNYCHPGNVGTYNMSIIKEIVTLGYNNGSNSTLISSDARAVYYCVNDNIPTNNSSYHPGKVVIIPIITVGQFNGTSPDTVTYSTCDVEESCSVPSIDNCLYTNCKLSSDLQATHPYCTNYRYLVTGDWNKTSTKLLNIGKTDIFGSPYFTSYQVIIKIILCPFGFENWNDSLSICSANNVLMKYDIASDVDTLSVLRNNTMWIGNRSLNTLAVHTNCPYDYCNASSITFRITDEQDHQCNHNRMGVLCGGCKSNTSAVFGSNRCLSCTNQSLWLLILFFLMGVALVALPFLLNCTVSVGTINGLILYTNIITPGIVNRLPFSDTGIFIFISWFNLNFGVETCFYNGMDTIVKTWLQFVFPVYILLLVGAFIFVSRWSSLLTRLCRGNAVAVLATLILLSYTKILETVITVLASTKLDVGNSTAKNPPVWLADGTILYAQGEHAPLLAAGVVITVTFLFPYTLILLLAPWIQAKSQWKVFSWINKLKPFIDAHQAPFKDQYCYWPGVLLMVRVVLYIVFIINEGNNINANLLAIALVLCSYAFITSTLSVYKYWPLSILENCFLINLIFLSSTLLYIDDVPSNNARWILNFSGGIFLAVSMGVILYHLYVQLKENSFLTRACSSLMRKRTKPVLLLPIPAGVTDDSKGHANYGSDEYREPLMEVT